MTDKKNVTDRLQTQPKKIRWVYRIFVGFIILVFVLSLGLAVVSKVTYDSWTKNSLPQVQGELQVKGLNANVTISRDKWGVPYLVASTTKDLAFAQGYTTAQDRLWQMDLLRRAAKGELSAVLGAGDKDSTLEVDKLHRSLGIKRTVEKDFPQLPEELRTMLEAYAQGVNAYLESHKDKLPFEFRLLGYSPDPWKPTDSLAVGKLMALSLTNNWKFDMMRAELAGKLDKKVYQMLFDDGSNFNQPIFSLEKVAEKPTEKPLTEANKTDNPDKNDKTKAQTSENKLNIDPKLFALVEKQNTAISDLFLTSNEAMIGSNNWVISGKLTDTGKPLLANDPHQGLSTPAIWYQISLRATDGTYAAAGVSVIGAPGIVIGHNDYIAWGATNVMADVQDLYIEEFDPANPTRYRVGQEWRDGEVIKEQIQVRESLLSSKTKTIEHEIVITRHGPIVASLNNQKVALRWVGATSKSELPVTYKLNHAHNWQEFCDALKDAAVPLINYIYADKEGNIGYYAVGRMPIRATGKGDLPYDGRTEDGEWKGFIPFEEQPHLYNPEIGYIATANQKLVDEKYPYIIGNDWAPPYRSHRIYELLAKKKQFTFEDMRQLHGDVYAIPTKFFADQVVKMAANHKDDSEWKQLEKDLSGWDGNLTVDSRAAAIAVTMRDEFTEDFLKFWLGDLRPTYNWYLRASVIDHVISGWSADFLPNKYKDFDSMVMAAYKATTKSLTEKIGSDSSKWNYGAINKVAFAHPLAKSSMLKSLFNSPEVTLGGSAHTINCNDTKPDRIWGPSMRMIISLDDLDKTTLTVAPGTSGVLGSTHYSDQVTDWANLQPHSFPVSEKNIEGLIVNKLVLQPAK